MNDFLNQYDINRDDYAGKIKDRCFLCGVKMKNNWDYYVVFGNCCRQCNARIGNKKKSEEVIERHLT